MTNQNLSTKRILQLWAPVVLWAWLIFFLSSIPHLHSGFGVWDFFLRKGAHITEYLIFTALCYRAVKETWILSLNKAMALSFFIALLYSASDEFHQLFVAGREGSVRDVLIDSCGMLLFVLIIRLQTQGKKVD